MKNCSRREFIKAAGLAAGAVLLPGISGAESIFASKTAMISMNKTSIDKKPNIIFILADDMGYGELGCYGQTKMKTPKLDQMASEGMRFTQHYSGGPVCAPSRACLMTGKHQGTGYIKGNPVGGEDTAFRPQDLIIPEILKSKGYDTACIGKWGLGPVGTTGYPTNKGFDYFCGYDTHVSAHDYWPTSVCRNNGTVALPGNESGNVTYSHDFFTTEALNYIDKPRNNPFFIYLGFTIPHEPYDPPLVKADGKDDEYYALYKNESWTAERKKIAAMVSRLDGSVGKVLDKLKAKGIDNDTIVIFASDNGPGSSYNTANMARVDFFQDNGPLIGMKRDVYDGGVREPFIIRWPGKIMPGVSTHISGFQDVLPTLAEIAGADVPEGIDGITMLPTLLGSGEQRQHTFLYWEYIHNNVSWGGRQSALMVNGNYKGVRYGSTGRLELYDLDTDIAEQNDIADQHPEIVSQIEAFMNTRSASELWPMPTTGNKFPLSGMQDWFVK